MPLTLRQLRYVIALGEHASFTRGAAAAGVSQPSFSQQIQLIETTLGGRVVERGGNRAFLTPLGRDVVAGARRVLAEVAAIEALADNPDDALTGTIRLGVSPTLGPYLLPRLVARLHSTSPDLRVHVREGLPNVLVELLADGTHDVILIQLPINDRGFHVERLFREPLLLAMAIMTFFAVRDLGVRAERSSRTSMLLERVSTLYLSGPPSLRSVREAMRREGQPITFRWVLFGTMVTVGAMTVGLAVSVAFGHWAHVDFSIVDEHDVSTTAPVALLGSGLLAAFPVSGYLIAKASNLPTLLEPALASGLAIGLILVMLGFAAPVALVFALAFSPIAWGLACAGAWVGRPS